MDVYRGHLLLDSGSDSVRVNLAASGAVQQEPQYLDDVPDWTISLGAVPELEWKKCSSSYS